MSHRLLRSLVLSSVVLLESAGCTLSHRSSPPPDPDTGPGGDGGPPPPEDGGAPGRDGGWLDDAGRVRDAAAVRDAWLDAEGPTDAGGLGFDAGDVRLCEDGWPPTKGFWCVMQDDAVLCCRSVFLADGGMVDEACCLGAVEGS